VSLPSVHDVYVAGNFGLYKNGKQDIRFCGDGQGFGNPNTLNDVFVDGRDNVHACGYRMNISIGAFEAVHYMNGARTVLEKKYSGAKFRETDTRGIFVDGADVYICGFEAFYVWTDLADWAVAPRLWKNGLQVNLESYEHTGDEWCYARAVRVHDGDVYVVGYTDIVDFYDRPAIWKNGKLHLYADMEDYFILDFGISAAGVLYVLCENDAPEYWGVAQYTVWAVQPDLETWTLVFSQWETSDMPEWMAVSHLAVDGDDWYVVGYIDYESYYWKNGGEPVMVQHPDSAFWVEADDVFAIDGDVYVAGCAADDEEQNSFSIMQWLNGELITGDGAINETIPKPPGYPVAIVRGMYVKPKQ
jgi:hypothetical protein